MKRFLGWLLVLLVVFGLFSTIPAFAEEAAKTPEVSAPVVPAAPTSGFSLPDTFWPGVLGSFVFGLVGIVLAFLAYAGFDILTPGLSLKAELGKNNTAVGIVVAALILGAFYLAGVVVH